MHDVRPGKRVEELARKVVHRADSGGRIVQLARVRLGARDELARLLNGESGTTLMTNGYEGEHRNHRDVLQRVEGIDFSIAGYTG